MIVSGCVWESPVATNTATLAPNVGLNTAREAEWELVRRMEEVMAAYREDAAVTRRGMEALLGQVEREALRRQAASVERVVTASGTESPRPRTTPEKPAAGVPLIPRPRAALRLVEGAAPGPGTSAVTTAGDPVSTPPVHTPRLAVKRAAPGPAPRLAAKRAAPGPAPWLAVQPAAPVPAPRLAVMPAAPVPNPRLAVMPAAPGPAPRLAVMPAAPVPAPRLAVMPAAPVPAPRLAVMPAAPVPAPRLAVMPAAPVPAPRLAVMPAAPVPAPRLAVMPAAPVPNPRLAVMPAAPVPNPRLAVKPAAPVPSAPVPTGPVPAALVPAGPVPVAPAGGPVSARRPTPAGSGGLGPVARATGQRRPPARPPERLSGRAGILSWSMGGGSRSGRITPWPEIGGGGMWR